MKHLFLAVPAVALFAAGAFAQTDTTTGATTGTDAGATVDATVDTTTGATTGTSADGSVTFGTNWPLSVGTTFFMDADSGTLRTSDEIGSGWQSLSQEDRDMIKADCLTFMAAHGDAAPTTGADASTGTSTDTTAGASTDAGAATDTATTGTATDTTADAATSTDTATGTGTASTEGTIATAVGYDMTEMKAICEAVQGL